MPQKHYEWELGDGLPEIGAHSLAKHRILRRYIERYIEIVTAISWQEQLSITFVDGYAGGGRYVLGRETVPGSPLILLEAVAAAEAKLKAARPKGFHINAQYIFVDQNPSHVEFLRSEIAASPFAPELDRTIQIWTADFNERVDDIVRIARERSPRAGKAIFLLDQYGWSQVAFRSIRVILEQLQKAEVYDHAKTLSRAELKQQLPRLIYQAADSDVAPSLEDLFGIRCNDTPVVRELLEEVLISLRGDRELVIVDETGRAKPRANTIEWTDRIKLPAQRSFFGPLSEFEKTKK